MTAIALGFSLQTLTVPLANLLPSRQVPEGLDVSRKFKQIRSSIEEIGLIEPLSITPEIKKTGNHMLLDGHIRLIALRGLGAVHAPCLVAKDDEGYTYNSRINRLSTIQEHFMIRRRSLEPLALLWIRLAVRRGRNPNFTWAMMKR